VAGLPQQSVCRRDIGRRHAGSLRRSVSAIPDAHRKDNEALRNYFSAHTTVAESTLGLIVATFKALAAVGDFETAAPVTGSDSGADTKVRASTKSAAEAPRDLRVNGHSTARPAININIQLQLPATEDGAIYDKLFAALKKHLFT
jgi:hypothetical protein